MNPDLSAINLDDLEISEFLDDTRLQDGDVAAKVMSASCTTCECYSCRSHAATCSPPPPPT